MPLGSFCARLGRLRDRGRRKGRPTMPRERRGGTLGRMGTMNVRNDGLKELASKHEREVAEGNVNNERTGTLRGADCCSNLQNIRESC